MIDGISVYKARLKMGEKLADKILRLHPDHDIDVVIPIPDTSTTAALPMAHRLDVKYRQGLIKNRYVGRTFIMPGQAELAHETFTASIPLGRYGDPLDIANMMLYLGSDEASFITGGTFMADGGMTLR